LINPCNLPDVEVTSMEKVLLGKHPTVYEVGIEAAKIFESLLYSLNSKALTVGERFLL